MEGGKSLMFLSINSTLLLFFEQLIYPKIKLNRFIFLQFQLEGIDTGNLYFTLKSLVHNMSVSL